jgi:hypothetical protein
VEEVAVMIPVYKPSLSPYELISLRRCVQVLGQRRLVLVGPEGLDLTAYRNEWRSFDTRVFEPKWFTSISAYSRLLLSPMLYEAFGASRFMLIYQLDAFVFRDELSAFCAEGFDYNGAPWIGDPWLESVRSLLPPSMQDKCVGNGGLSLRHVEHSLRVLHELRELATTWRGEEDLFWCHYVPAYSDAFKIADLSSALRFSFERSPAKCYELAGGKIPFGCHAWEKYDLDFWRPFFRDVGYEV